MQRNDNYSDYDYHIQSKFNEFRIKLYAILIYYYKTLEYFDTFDKQIIQNGIASLQILKNHFFKKIPLYILKNEDSIKKIPKSINNNIIPHNTVFILQESYYKVCAIRLIVQELLNYWEKLNKYKIYLHNKIVYAIDTQNNFRKIYDYFLNIAHSNGNEYDKEYQKMLNNFIILSKNNTDNYSDYYY